MSPKDYIPQIIERLSKGEGLNTICKTEGFPDESSVRAWYIDDVDGFAPKYARARELGMDARADRLRALAKKARGKDAAYVAAIRLEIDTEKWYLSKIAPKRYGEKLDVNSSEGLKLVIEKRVIGANDNA